LLLKKTFYEIIMVRITSLIHNKGNIQILVSDSQRKQ